MKIIEVRSQLKASKSICINTDPLQRSNKFRVSRLNHYTPILKKYKGISEIDSHSSLGSISEEANDD